jgi:manganese oxidase
MPTKLVGLLGLRREMKIWLRKLPILGVTLTLALPMLLLLPAATTTTGKTRTFYIGVEKILWDYAPSGQNKIKNIKLTQDPDAAIFTVSAANRVGRKYQKLRYTEFTDSSFKTRKADIDPSYRATWQHLGLLGPTLHAEVGDTLKVVLKNLTPAQDKLAISLHVHGAKYDKSSEGALYNDGTSGKDKLDDAVKAGQTYTYTWHIDEAAGPAKMDGSSIVWMYHSHTDEITDTYSGLLGALIVTAQGQAKPDGSPQGINREFVTAFEVMNENKSLLAAQNFARFSSQTTSDPEFEESNLMHAINGFVYGNLPGLNVKLGEKIRWYTLAMGTEVDLHTPHWHGETVEVMGTRMDMLELLPGSMKVADMTPRSAGTWLYHCHVNDHITAGMQALFTVSP